MAGDESRRTGKRSKTKKKRTPQTVNRSERTPNTLPKLEREGATMEKVPSNAPTMAIAPSDYEHIFHEAATGQPQSPSPPPPPPSGPRLPPAPTLRIRTPEPQLTQDQEYQQPLGTGRYAAEVQVTPDGYTMLGHTPDPNPHRRIALPPHIVRASNQFSRAALQRVARYLASRAEQPKL